MDMVSCLVVASALAVGSPPCVEAAVPVREAVEVEGGDSDRRDRVVSITLRPLNLRGLPDAWVHVRMTDQLSASVHGSYWRPKAGGTAWARVKLERGWEYTVGTGLQYHFRGFERGWFVGGDVSLTEHIEANLGRWTYIDAQAKGGWKCVKDSGFTYGVDIGVGPGRQLRNTTRGATRGRGPANGLMRSGGIHVGWSF